MKKLTIGVFAIVSAFMLRAATYNGVTYSTSGDIVPGEWTSQFSKAKSYADAKNIPLVVVWANPGCGYCAALETEAMYTKRTRNWMKAKKYVFVFALGTTTSDGEAAKAFAKIGSLFPYCCAYWKRNNSGKTVSYRFCGREENMITALLKPIPKGLDEIFIKTVDQYIGDYAGGTTPTDPVDEVKYALSVVSSGNGTVSGGGSYKPGTVVKLKATAAKGYILSGWYSNSQLLSQEATYKYETGSSAKTLTAKFIAKSDDSVTIGAIKAKDEYETKQEIAPITLSVMGGSLPTLSVTKLPSGLKFTAKAITGHAANTIYGTPTKSGIYSAQIIAKTAGGAKAPAILPLVVRAKNERIIRVDCDATKGKVSGGGVFADGKKASVRATALSKQCFTGWSIGGTLVSRSTSYSYPVDGKDVTLEANFVSKEADLASVTLKFAGKEQIPSVVQTNVVRCGVSTNWTVVAKALSGTSVTASGLPSGLKLVKTLIDKELKEYAYEISGAPSSASKLNTKTGLVKPTIAKIKVTTLGKNTVTYQYAFVIEALPAWAYGNFGGFAAADLDGTGAGTASLTVSSAGKISGKFALFGTNWTYSATGYAACEKPDDPVEGKFRFEGLAKKSKLTLPFAVEVTPGVKQCSVVSGEGEDWFMTLHRKVWSDKPALPSPKLAKTDLSDFGYASNLTVSVSSSGTAAFSGRLNDGTKVSSSSSLVFIDEKELYQVYFVVPYSKTFNGYVDEISIDPLKE